MLYYGPVRVTSDAVPGKAIVRVELPASSMYRSFPTDIPIQIK